MKIPVFAVMNLKNIYARMNANSKIMKTLGNAIFFAVCQ
jgi:hypothetical protein